MAKSNSAGPAASVPSTAAAKKAAREGKVARTQARKAVRRREQEEAEARNKLLRARGELTPWQAAKAKAKERRVTARALAKSGTGGKS